MEQAIVDWRNWLLASGKSQATVTGYEWDLRALARRYPALEPWGFKIADLNRYQAERLVAGVGDQARKRSASAMRSFFKFACGTKSPAKTLPVPRPKRRAQRVLDWEQAGAVLAACETTTARGLRDLALLCLMMESALRCSEVCRLELKKVSLEQRRLTVLVKGGHERQGAFDQVTAEYLAAWIAVRAQFAQPDTGTLFCSVGGLTPGKPLTPEGLRGIFRKIGQAAGLTQGFSPHDLRRSCATLKTRLGAPSRTVQVGGGWSNLKEVERYTASISLDDFERYSPVTHLLRPPAPAPNVKPGV